ncbi:MAG: tetratricopeptide repeat protein, partial [Acidobacteriota bacterium]
LAIQESLEFPNRSLTAQAWYELGLSFRAQGRYDESEGALHKALQIYADLERDSSMAAVREDLAVLAAERGAGSD